MSDRMKTSRDFNDDMAAIMRHATDTGETVAILNAAGEARGYVSVPGPPEFPCCDENRDEIASLRTTVAGLEAERGRCLAALRDVVAALGNGSFVDAQCSTAFHLEAPGEVRACVERITKERDAARADALAASNHYMRVCAVRDAQAEALRVVTGERDALLAAMAECGRLAGEIVAGLDWTTLAPPRPSLLAHANAIVALAEMTPASAATAAAGRKP